MAVQKRLSTIGYAKQSAKGTPATVPTYNLGLTGGHVVSTNVDEAELPTSWSTRGLEGYDRLAVVTGADPEHVAMPASIGLLLLLALGGVVTTPGPPDQHVFTPANTLPYATLFSTFGTEKATVDDAKLDTLELSWDRSGSLKVKTTFMGCSLVFGATFTGGTDDRVAGGTLRGSGGVFTVNGQNARITAGTITISNNCTAVVGAASTTPDEVFEGDSRVKISLTVVPDDLALYKHAVTGSNTGTTPSGAPAFGTMQFKWIKDTNDDLQFDGGNVEFLCEFPATDPQGGPAELTLEGNAIQNTDGTPGVTFTLHNGVASY